jgi:CheY-like chemotaxis protein
VSDRPRARPESGTRPRVARVLIVDDEPFIAKSLQLVLSDEFEVVATTDATAALEWLVSGDWYDVILCDVMMPMMNGVEFRDRVDLARPDLAARIVFVTGGVFWDRVHKLIESVPNVVLEKPFDMAALRELIRRRTASEPPPRRASRS